MVVVRLYTTDMTSPLVASFLVMWLGLSLISLLWAINRKPTPRIALKEAANEFFRGTITVVGFSFIVVLVSFCIPLQRYLLAHINFYLPSYAPLAQDLLRMTPMVPVFLAIFIGFFGLYCLIKVNLFDFLPYTKEEKRLMDEHYNQMVRDTPRFCRVFGLKEIKEETT